MKYKNIREEKLKNIVGADWFAAFDTTEILGNIDFTVFPRQSSIFGRLPLLWVEAKTGNFDILAMFVQLILTIRKALTFYKTLPPAFLGAFHYTKMAFVPYSSILDIFYLNDFNWNITPSNLETKEFGLIKLRKEASLQQNSHLFDFIKDDVELKNFIENNIAKARDFSKIHIDKNNFHPIYLRWLDAIKPIIDINWEKLKKVNIFNSDFYLADLFVNNNDINEIDDDISIRDNLFVVFSNRGYKITKKNLRQIFDAFINQKDKVIYTNFWKIYKRPPINQNRDYFIERRDRLVAQDIRERKVAFFMPRIWVGLSQKYFADFLGENWQEEYYIWDCDKGKGNLLAGLTNKFNIYASTLNQTNVNVIHKQINHGANLLKNFVFQFDFLNDDFTPISKGGKIPNSLYEITNDPAKRKKIIIYINPPYAEARNRLERAHKKDISHTFSIYEKFKPIIGNAVNKIFALLMANIYEKKEGGILVQFYMEKFVNGSNFKKFKNYFLAEFVRGFVILADTFYNVKEKFPIGFTILDTNKKVKMETITTDVYKAKGNSIDTKNFYGNLPKEINEWISHFQDKKNLQIGILDYSTPDFLNRKYVFIIDILKNETNDHRFYLYSLQNNLNQGAKNFSVRHCITSTRLNDRDQLLFPKYGGQNNSKFQNDFLAFTLFRGQNKLTSNKSENHWIPFLKQEVKAQGRFKSPFLTNYIKEKIKPAKDEANIFNIVSEHREFYEVPLKFSDETLAVFKAGKKLWRYYHSKPDINVNASLYKIREYFQGRSNGRINAKSDDQIYLGYINEMKTKPIYFGRKNRTKSI